MDDNPAEHSDKIIERALEDLVDDAERLKGKLQRANVDALYLRRGITPEQAVAIERALKAHGIELLEPAEDDTDVESVLMSTKKGIYSTALDHLSSIARRHPLLNATEEIELGEAIQAALQISEDPNASDSPIAVRIIARGEEARKRLITSNIRLVIRMAMDKRYRTRLDPDDLVQMGLIGLMRAAEKFDPSWETRFSTYAVWWIRQSMSRGIADHGATIRIPVHMQAVLAKYRRARRVLGYTGTFNSRQIRSIAEKLGWDEAYTGRIAQVSELHTVSIDAPIGRDGEFTISDGLAAPEPSPESFLLEQDLTAVVNETLGTLNNERMEDIVRRRFGFNGSEETLQEIGDDYGITRERIRQIEEKALRLLRHPTRFKRLHSVV